MNPGPERGSVHLSLIIKHQLKWANQTWLSLTILLIRCDLDLIITEHFRGFWVTTSTLTEQVSVALLCRLCRLLMEKRRRDLLLRLAKLRSGDIVLWNLTPPSPPSSSSLSSSSSSCCFSSAVPHTSSRAPCKERRTLPTQPATCSWAADSFPPKYCMVEKLTQLVVWALGSPWELGHHRSRFSFVRDGGIDSGSCVYDLPFSCHFQQAEEHIS